jgi:hypothetical protein
MSTTYALGEHAAVRGVLDRLRAFAGSPDIRDRSTNGWVSVSTSPSGEVSLATCRDDVAARLTLPGSVISGDSAPAELLVPAEWLARVAALANSLGRPLDLVFDRETGRAALAGLGSIQVVDDRPGPDVWAGPTTTVATVPRDGFVMALKRAKISTRGRNPGDLTTPLAGYTAITIFDSKIYVAATDGYLAYLEEIENASVSIPGLQLIAPAALTHSLLANLSPFFGETICLAVDDTDHPARLVITGESDTVASVRLSGVKYPGPERFIPILEPILDDEVPAVFADQRQLAGWIKALAGAGTHVDMAATPAGARLVSAGNTPPGHVAQEMLELPTGAAASRGIAEARIQIDMLRRGVAALGGVGEVDDETDETTELSPGTMVVALTTFPGSNNPAMALGAHISRVDLPTAAVYVAGTKLSVETASALASAGALTGV